MLDNRPETGSVTLRNWVTAQFTHKPLAALRKGLEFGLPIPGRQSWPHRWQRPKSGNSTIFLCLAFEDSIRSGYPVFPEDVINPELSHGFESASILLIFSALVRSASIASNLALKSFTNFNQITGSASEQRIDTALPLA